LWIPSIARLTWTELLKVNPQFLLSQRARVLPYKDPAEFRSVGCCCGGAITTGRLQNAAA
jgi:hypothetical protein